jgi:vanillate/3-O-methylgallate O-demethylase
VLIFEQAEAAFPTPSIDFLPALYGGGSEMSKYLEFLKKSTWIHLDMANLAISGSYSSTPADHERTPYDLGRGWLVEFEHDFIGKEALRSVAANAANEFVALEWNIEDVTDVFASLFREKPYDYMEMPRSVSVARRTLLFSLTNFEKVVKSAPYKDDRRKGKLY